jgi:hypothetical protein
MSAPELYRLSSYRENMLEYLFASAVMRHLWQQEFRRVEILRSQVDDSGYDLVLEANSVVRHVQLKSSHATAKAAKVDVSLDLAKKPSGCVIWLRFDPISLALGPFLWFGCNPGELLPEIGHFPIAKHAKGNAQGVKLPKMNQRQVPKSAFIKLPSIEEVVERLFGEWQEVTLIP